ncbi:hypothetical protein BBR01nite_58690 [Brevibacillus brevis]|nr:hypothetical protein BBR01nite_58690 [Brevibacillus brevis]
MSLACNVNAGAACPTAVKLFPPLDNILFSLVPFYHNLVVTSSAYKLRFDAEKDRIKKNKIWPSQLDGELT